MATETVLAAIAGALCALLVGWLLMKRRADDGAAESKRQQDLSRDLDRQTHVQKCEFLEQHNQVELLHLEALKEARAAAYEDGRRLGNAERRSDHVTEITEQRAEFAAKVQFERDQAAKEARERLRSEYELQTKLFTVQISPFVRIVDIKEYFKKKSDVQTGYQYQLLVNGIPAFQPHLIIESDERKEFVDEENIKELAALARHAAEAAVQTYLGGSAQFVKMAAGRVLREVAGSVKRRVT